MENKIRKIIFNPKYEINEFAKDKDGKWDSVQEGKLSLIKELTSEIYKHSDENTEAYCENLQRENQYLRDKLSTEGKVIARGELFTDEESWLNSFIENGNSIIRLDALCEKIDKDYAGQNIEIKILHIDK